MHEAPATAVEAPPPVADNVVDLRPGERPAEPARRVASPPGSLHGLSITAMALSALIGIVALFSSITFRFSEQTARYPRVIFALAAVVFIASASIAVFSAARDSSSGPRPIPEDKGSDN